MTKISVIEAKNKRGEVKKPLALSLPPEERLKIFANLIIDRILEEQTKGNLKELIKKE